MLTSINYQESEIINDKDYKHPTGFHYKHERNKYNDYYGWALRDKSNFILKWKNDKNTFVVPYDPMWPLKAQKEIDLLKHSVSCIDVEHIGSTAVEGLVARPTIDLIMTITLDEFLHNRKELIDKIVSQGYTHVGYETRPDRLFFVKRQKDDPEGLPEFHLHICVFDSSYHNIRIMFRDLLISNKSIRERYSHDKIMITKNYPNDRFVYYQTKSVFILTSISVSKVDAASSCDALVVGCDW